MNKKTKFSLEQEYSIKAYATFIAQLEREGVTYNVSQNGPDIYVELTGGF